MDGEGYLQDEFHYQQGRENRLGHIICQPQRVFVCPLKVEDHFPVDYVFQRICWRTQRLTEVGVSV